MDYFDRLFPITRSITGDGVRETLKILSEIADLKIHEIPTGEKCFDWEIPKEWNIRDAYIKNISGDRIIDFKKNNLHVLGYSVPVEGKFSRKELMEHLYTLPSMPDAIPYLTSYYEPKWGFCLEHNTLLTCFEDDEYDVKIDSTLEPGSLTIGEA